MADGYHIAETIFSHRDWMDAAECRKVPNPDIFFPEAPSEKRSTLQAGGYLPVELSAKRVCLRCPVRDECLRYCLEMEDGPNSNHGVSDGVWGGTLPRERRKVRTKTAHLGLDAGDTQFAALSLLVLDQARTLGLCKESEVVHGT